MKSERRGPADRCRRTRRAFLSSAAGGAGWLLLPRRTAISAPSLPTGALRAAFVGAGGRAVANVGGLAAHARIVAFADVDERKAADTYRRHPDVPRYRDYRRMLEERAREIDVVVVSTPDHTHACAALAAIRLGKHVYCEKPLAHSIAAVRALMRAARERGVVTQLGNQGHSSQTIRMFCEWVWAGAIGNVHTVHAWCSKVHSRIRDLWKLAERPAPPDTLDWDGWLGPAPFRPYHPMYCPGAWRDWSPFGCGTIGDWVCHVVDPVFWALDLGAPATVRAVHVGEFDPTAHSDTFPRGSHIEYRFPARRARGAVVLNWYDGEAKPPRPPELEPDRKLPDIGAVVVGDRGAIVYGSHGASSPRIIPEAKMKEFRPPEPSIPRVKGHHEDFVEAIRQGRPAGSNFDYGGPLTELALLGIIAQRFPGVALEWDGAAGRFVGHDGANRLVRPPTPRPGWPLE